MKRKIAFKKLLFASLSSVLISDISMLYASENKQDIYQDIGNTELIIGSKVLKNIVNVALYRNIDTKANSLKKTNQYWALSDNKQQSIRKLAKVIAFGLVCGSQSATNENKEFCQMVIDALTIICNGKGKDISEYEQNTRKVAVTRIMNGWTIFNTIHEIAKAQITKVDELNILDKLKHKNNDDKRRKLNHDLFESIYKNKILPLLKEKIKNDSGLLEAFKNVSGNDEDEQVKFFIRDWESYLDEFWVIRDGVIYKENKEVTVTSVVNTIVNAIFDAQIKEYCSDDEWGFLLNSSRYDSKTQKKNIKINIDNKSRLNKKIEYKNDNIVGEEKDKLLNDHNNIVENKKELPEVNDGNKNKVITTAGLTNHHGNCYINAVVQCFANTPGFKDFLLDTYRKNKEKIEKGKDPQTAMFKEFLTVVEEMWHEPEMVLDGSDPTQIMKTNVVNMDKFREFIIDLYPTEYDGKKLDYGGNPLNVFLGIISNLLKVFSQPDENVKILDNYNDVDVSKKSVVLYSVLSEEKKKGNFDIKNWFLHILETYKKHQEEKCGCEVYSYGLKVATDFNLPGIAAGLQINNRKLKLSDCFKYNARKTMRTGENNDFCNSIKNCVDAFEESKSYYTPPILIVQLNYGLNNAADVAFEIEEKVDLNAFIVKDNNNKKDAFYKLYGVILQNGKSGSGGHFTACCLSKDGNEWIWHNDTRSTILVDDPNVEETGKAYKGCYLAYKRYPNESMGTDNVPIYLFYVKVSKDEYKSNNVDLQKAAKRAYNNNIIKNYMENIDKNYDKIKDELKVDDNEIAKKFGLSKTQYQRNFNQFNLYVSRYGAIKPTEFSDKWNDLRGHSDLYKMKAREFIDYIKEVAKYDETVINKIKFVCNNASYRQYLLMLFLYNYSQLDNLIKSEFFEGYKNLPYSMALQILDNQFAQNNPQLLNLMNSIIININEMPDFYNIDNELCAVLQNNQTDNKSAEKKVTMRKEENQKAFDEFMQCKFKFYENFFDIPIWDNQNCQSVTQDKYESIGDVDSLVVWKMNKYQREKKQPIDEKQKNTIMEELKKQETTRGIPNIGATCYMNAALQCLLNNTEFVSYLYTKNINNKEQQISSKYLIDLYKTLWQADYSKNGIIKKEITKKEDDIIGKIMKNYREEAYNEDKHSIAAPGWQGDAKDVLLKVLQDMHKLLKVSNSTNSNTSYNIKQNNKLLMLDDNLNGLRKEGDSIVNDLFSCIKQTKTLCHNCQSIFQNKLKENIYAYLFQAENYFISLPLKSVYDRLINMKQNFQLQNSQQNTGFNNQIYYDTNYKKIHFPMVIAETYNAGFDQWPSVTIEDIFEYLRRQTILDGKNTQFCNMCKQISAVSQITEYVTLPRYLVLLLEIGTNLMNRTTCKVPEKIDLSNFVLTKRPTGWKYELQAMIVNVPFVKIADLSYSDHSKVSWLAHYVTVTKPFDTWYIHDDNKTCHIENLWNIFDGKKFPLIRENYNSGNTVYWGLPYIVVYRLQD